MRGILSKSCNKDTIIYSTVSLLLAYRLVILLQYLRQYPDQREIRLVIAILDL